MKDLTILAMMLLIVASFLYLVGIGMNELKRVAMALHVVPPTAKADQTSYFAIRHTVLPNYLSQKTHFEIEDGGPVGKWAGRFTSFNGIMHMITVLCFVVRMTDKPAWIVKTAFVQPNQPYTMTMILEVEARTPEEFSALYPQLEAEITKQEPLWESRKF